LILADKEPTSLDMEFFESLRRNDSSPVAELFSRLEQELVEALDLYWSIAGEILDGSGIRLLDPPAEYRTLRRNFFSALFLFSYHRASIPRERRVSYAAINHCLRGMVTGCDNILDSEYKPTLFTDLPTEATQFRSVLDIMVSDRVLFQILLQTQSRDGLHPDKVFKASAASLRALTWSGVQEASEEKGTDTILEPEKILTEVHHYKTGLLFQCPWAVPLLAEPDTKGLHSSMLEALYWIGMGCQIMDDMVDFASDVERRRHNFIVSLIRHGEEESERMRLKAIQGYDASGLRAVDLPPTFPRALQSARNRVESFLHRGLESLLPVELRAIIPAVVQTLATLIGARRLMERS
jgi:hypothetical protein